MPTVWRIRDRATFGALRRSGRRVRSAGISLTWLPGPAGTPPRVAYAVGRQVGPAVARNRLKRRLRATVAALAGDLAPGAYLISAGPTASALDPDEMRTSVSTLLAAASRPSRKAPV